LIDFQKPFTARLAQNLLQSEHDILPCHHERILKIN